MPPAPLNARPPALPRLCRHTHTQAHPPAPFLPSTTSDISLRTPGSAKDEFSFKLNIAMGRFAEAANDALMLARFEQVRARPGPVGTSAL